MITTGTTVGYGDITPVNRIERIFCMVNMVIGVLAFTFASGSLSSIIANADSTEADLNERLLLVHRLRRIYNFSEEM